MALNRRDQEIVDALRRPRSVDEWKYKYVYQVRPFFVWLMVGLFVASILAQLTGCGGSRMSRQDRKEAEAAANKITAGMDDYPRLMQDALNGKAPGKPAPVKRPPPVTRH